MIFFSIAFDDHDHMLIVDQNGQLLSDGEWIGAVASTLVDYEHTETGTPLSTIVENVVATLHKREGA
jgi:phosphomannomutase